MMLMKVVAVARFGEAEQFGITLPVKADGFIKSLFKI